MDTLLVAEWCFYCSEFKQKGLTLFFTVFLPAIITIMTLMSASSGRKNSKGLLWFYLATFSGIFSSMVAVFVFEFTDVLIAGPLVGFLAGSIAGIILLDGSLFGFAGGGLTSGLIGFFSINFLRAQQYEIIIHYCVLLFIVECVSFCMAKVIQVVKE